MRVTARHRRKQTRTSSERDKVTDLTATESSTEPKTSGSRANEPGWASNSRSLKISSSLMIDIMRCLIAGNRLIKIVKSDVIKIDISLQAISPLLPRLEKRGWLILLVDVLAVVPRRGHHLRLQLDHVAALTILVRKEIRALDVSLVGWSEVVLRRLLGETLAVLKLWRWRRVGEEAGCLLPEAWSQLLLLGQGLHARLRVGLEVWTLLKL